MRVVLIGLGAAARNIHLPALRKLPGRVALAGGADPSVASRNAFATAAPGVPLFEDSATALATVRPDALVICAPPSTHAQLMIEALEAGCHVFCEKPLAESAADADAIVDACSRSDRVVAINHEFRSIPIYSATKAQIGTAAFGDIAFAHAWQTFRPTEHTEAGWRAEARRRACLDFGVHVFDLLRHFFGGDPVTVFAQMPDPFGRARSDVIATIVLEFPQGRGATIVLDRAAKGEERYLEMRIDGEEASIVSSIGGQLRFEAGIRPRGRRPFFRFHVAGGGVAYLQTGDRSRLLARAPLNVFTEATAVHLADFLDAVENGRQPMVGIGEARAALFMALAAYESAERGAVIDFQKFSGREAAAHAR